MLEIGTDAFAIFLMFCWAGIIFLMAFLFEREHRRLKDNIEMIKRAKIARWRVQCMSANWKIKQPRRKIIAPRSHFMWMIVAGGWILAVVLFQILGTFKYAMFVPLLGLPIFLDDALEMYRYSRFIRGQPLEKLQVKDLEYMEEAIGVLAKKPRIYLTVGLMFLIAAPFIPQTFKFLLPFIIAEGAKILFRVSEYCISAFGLGAGLAIGLSLTVFLMACVVVLVSWIVSKLWREKT